jgi:hypothetical protein
MVESAYIILNIILSNLMLAIFITYFRRKNYSLRYKTSWVYVNGYTCFTIEAAGSIGRIVFYWLIVVNLE